MTIQSSVTEANLKKEKPIVGAMGIKTIVSRFYRYAIDLENLFNLGYPVLFDNRKVFIKSDKYPKFQDIYNRRQSALYSNNSKPNIIIEHFRTVILLPALHLPVYPGKFFVLQSTISKFTHLNRLNYPFNDIVSRICARCGKHFQMSPSRGLYVTKTPCNYHWGKIRCFFGPAMKNNPNYVLKCQQLYECCHKEKGSEGCTKAALHVWEGITHGKINGPYEDFVSTRCRIGYHDGEIKAEDKILALDCEMSYTAKGLEATKITVLNLYGVVVYNYFIKPESPIVDYNTRFSGIKESDFRHENRNKIKVLSEVQKDLLKIIFSDTILIGHSLENDLRVLKIVHYNIVDTAIVFPHSLGLPHRRSLKTLALRYLNRVVQDKSDGHDSFEDGNACIDLMLWKIKEDFDKE